MALSAAAALAGGPWAAGAGFGAAAQPRDGLCHADAAVPSGKRIQSPSDGGDKALRFLPCLGEVYLAIGASSVVTSQGMIQGSPALAGAGAASANCCLLGIAITSNCYPCC